MTMLHGKRILIAGGTGNVGRYLVQAHLNQGAAVVVPSRSPERLDALERRLDGKTGERFVPMVGDMADDADARRILDLAGPVDGAVASLGAFTFAPRILEARDADLQRTLDGYVRAHLAVARVLVPHLAERGGGYVMINGPLAFDPLHPGTGLVSIATAAQAMLARLLMKESADSAVRVNEVIVYSGFGWGNDDENVVTGADLGRFVAWLLSREGAGTRGETIHLRSPAKIPLENRFAMSGPPRYAR